ncbi:hypothetical protein LJC32_01050 [Oscillospiraceae bacterium OttesenSCG-928-F05]|nr:hypothetical protein [Oscillospiraceae bacterium OttesenSCG-928-F05]
MPTAYYMCDKCAKTFDKREDAAGCEKSHLAASSITGYVYRKGPYPSQFTVKFSDGTEIVFVDIRAAY